MRMMRRCPLTAAVALASLVVMLLVGCGRDSRRASDARVDADSLTGRRVLTSFSDRGVSVEISFEWKTRATASLCGRFTPTRPGFHLYATELPSVGIKGIGRPTRLTVVASATVRATGSAVADKPSMPLTVKPLGITFPVYPEGPVSLCMPVNIEDGINRTADLSVTYMTCSDQVCMAPVEDRRISVVIDGSR